MAKPALNASQRLALFARVERDGVSVAQACREFGVSRFTYYKWKKRWERGGRRSDSLKDKTPDYTRPQLKVSPKDENLILSLVVEYPNISKYELARIFAERIGTTVGVHGIYNVLRRHGLNTPQARLAYAEGFYHPPAESELGFSQKVTYSLNRLVRNLIPLPLPAFSFYTKFVFYLLIGVGVAFASVYSFSWWVNHLISKTPTVAVGTIFSTIALSAGTIFFLYSLKYYISLAIVLSFSQSESTEDIGHRAKGKRNIFSWILGLKKNGLSVPEAHRAGGPVGLTPNLEHVTLERYPKISVHIPLYNEKTVVERILNATTSFDYPSWPSGGYEVIIADDSTDETTEIVKQFLKVNYGELRIIKDDQGTEIYKTPPTPNKPSLTLIHRSNRSGFKGGALREALKHTDPKAEFVTVFDADFVPYPDTLELFLKYFKVQNSLSEDYSQSKVAAVQGYQWHVLNKSENWVTRGVRSEYAGSYVIERSGAEIYTGLKQISGAVYMIRRDVLEETGWETSITEDFQLTLKLYEKGYKVVYTPYIQAPAECVSTLKRLIRQRMRWAEGHSNNIKKMFTKLIFNRNLSLSEKLEFLYLSPYYLQSFFFLIGTFSWLISETLFPARLPFWTSLWGWSLVLTNFLSLPLMNAVGLFLEESEEKDYLGLTSFAILSYILVPFQAYASLKGFIERQEGPWFRTPKTGRITDIIRRGTFYRLISGILSGRSQPAVATSPIKANDLQILANNSLAFASSPYLGLATANNRFNSFNIKSRGKKWIAKSSIAFFLVLVLFIHQLAFLAPPAQATFTPAWYNTDWNFRMKITIDQTKVAGSADHSNFPVLIDSTVTNWKDTANGGKVGQSDGGDIVFTASNGTSKLSHEIEEYTSTTGALRAWVEVTTLDFDTNTDIYIYYGNSAVADQWDINGTWNPVYTLVYHFENNSFTDSRGTSNALNQSTTNVAGIVGDGRDANGSSQYVETNYTPAITATEDYTYSIWASADLATGRDSLFGSEDSDGIPEVEASWRDDTDVIGFQVRDDANSGGAPDCSNSTINNGTIHQVALVHDDNANPSILTYFDGATLCNNAASVANGAHTHSCEVFVGADDLCGTGVQNHFNGQIDEFRLSITLLNAGWIETDYNTITSPSTFYTVASGSEEQVPEIVILLLPLAIIMPLFVRNLKKRREKKSYAIVRI